MKNIFITCFVLIFHGVIFSQFKNGEYAKLMKAYHNYNMFDGAVLVAHQGKVVYKEAFGLANREWNIKNTTSTKFLIGSIGKPLTSLLVLLQVQKGKIHLDSSISHYLPIFKNKPAAHCTIRQMINHTSGIQSYDIIKDFMQEYTRRFYNREAYIKVFVDSSLAFEPGTKFLYSSWAYFTLGYLVEQVTGKNFAQTMKEEIFDKINMPNSGSYYHKKIIQNRASGYDYTLGNYTSADFRDLSNAMGAGDVYSTVDDMFQLHLALQEYKILNKELTNLIFTPGMKPANFGLGWFNNWTKLTPKDSLFTNFHLGTMEGFISFMRRIPASNSMVIILCNSAPTDFFGITNNLIKLMHHIPVQLKQPTQKAIEKLIGTKGAAEAVKMYPDMIKDTANYQTDWISMHFIAEQLLQNKRLDDALIIAKANVTYFDDKDLILLDMANVQLALGNKEEAKIYYHKTLALFPNNQEAKNRLKYLE